MSKVKKVENTTPRTVTLQPGVHQDAVVDNSEHIIYDVNNEKSAQEHLLKNLMLMDDTPITLEVLQYALLHMAETSRISVVLHSTLHAIAILLKQTERDKTEEKLIKMISKGVQEKLWIPISQLSKAAISLEADMEALHSQLDDLKSSAVKQAISSIKSTAARVKTTTAILANSTTSYKDALLCMARTVPMDSPLLNPCITQHTLLQAKQVLIGFEGVVEVKESLNTLRERVEATIQHLLEHTSMSASKNSITIGEISRM